MSIQLTHLQQVPYYRQVMCRTWTIISAALLGLIVGCSNPQGRTTKQAHPTSQVIVRVWVENPMKPDAHLLAARSLSDAINASTDLSVVEISGFAEAIVEVRTDRTLLEKLGVEFSNVVSSVAEAVPGEVKKRMRVDPREHIVELTFCPDHPNEDRRINDTNDLQRATVKTASGDSIPLSIMCTISIRPGKPQASYQKQPALFISVNTGGAHKRLQQVLEQYRQKHPDVRVQQVQAIE
jgi:multidrug efflux pump subunit AcrB